MRARTSHQRQLASLPLFADCNNQELATVERLGSDVVIGPGRILFREEITPPQFLVVLEGAIDLTRAGDCIGMLLAGAWFGHKALLTRRATESSSGKASVQTRVLAFSRGEFASLLHAVPLMRQWILYPVPPDVSSEQPRQEIAFEAPAPRLRVPREVVGAVPREACSDRTATVGSRTQVLPFGGGTGVFGRH